MPSSRSSTTRTGPAMRERAVVRSSQMGWEHTTDALVGVYEDAIAAARQARHEEAR